MTEYRVWHEVGDNFGKYDTLHEAMSVMRRLVDYCIELNACDDSNCGVLYSHGYFVDECEDGQIIQTFS